MKRYTLLLGIGLLAVTAATTLSFAQTKQPVRSKPLYQLSESDDGIAYINMTRDGKRYHIKLVQEQLSELSVNGKPVPAAEFSQYTAMVQELVVQLRKDRAQAVLDREQAEEDRQQAGKDRAQAELDRAQAEKDRVQADRDRMQADKDRAQAELDRKQADKDRAQAELDRKQADKDRATAEIDRKKAEEDRRLVETMVAELVQQKLITDKQDNYSVHLTAASLVINGKEQAASVHQHYKAKYLKGDTMTIERIAGKGYHIYVQ